MLEVEGKYAVDDLAALEAQLVDRAVTLGPLRRDADHYFNAPDRDFARTDEAFRVRTIGQQNFVTYKGPKRDRETKTRLEIEVALAEGAEAAEAFRCLATHLGYRATGIVHKSRRVGHWHRDGFAMQVCLDDVDGVGQFAELEVVAAEAHYDAAKASVLAAAAELGLTRPERRSYLEMVLNGR